MSRATGIVAGAVTAAFPVATFTAAVTSSSALSRFSTRAAQDAHVIPLIDSSTSRNPAADATPVIAADIKSYLPAGNARPARERKIVPHPEIYTGRVNACPAAKAP